MCKINQRTFLKRMAELNGKRIRIDVEGMLKIEAEYCSISYSAGLVKIRDKANNNFVTINLSFAYAILADNENKEFQVFCDDDILFIIEELPSKQE